MQYIRAFLAIFLILLAACGTAPTVTEAPLPIQTPEPAVITTRFPGPTPTLAITDVAVPPDTPTAPSATGVEEPGGIPETGDEGDGTGDARGDAVGPPTHLSSILSYDIRDPSGVTIGKPSGLVIHLPAVPLIIEVDVQDPTYINYVILDPEPDQPLEDSSYFIPWSAFQTLVPSVEPENRALYLNVDQQVLSEAPNIAASVTPMAGVPGWDQDIINFWTGQGLNIQETDNFANSRHTLVSLPFSQFILWLSDGEELGTVSEFLVEPQTGQFEYVVLASGGGLGERVVPIPMERIIWTPDEAGSGPGILQVTADRTALGYSPYYSSLDELDTTQPGWDQEIKAYWINIE